MVREVQLATLVKGAPEGEGWVHEVKLDGYRVVGVVEGESVTVLTRNGKDWTDRFPDVAAALQGLRCDSAEVDAEVVVLDSRGVSSFQRLQNSLSGRGGRAGRPLLYAFDLLVLDGEDLSGRALLERKSALRALLESGSEEVRERIRYSDHVTGRGPEFFRKACGMGVEGIISKRADRPYRAGRSRDWLKVKCTARQEFVVVGYTEPSGSRVGLGALLLAVHDDDGALTYAGKVGTGFDNDTLLSLERRLSGLERSSPALQDPPRGAEAAGVHWVRPELVAEVEFTEWTNDGRVRHPSFQGLREDKDPAEVVRETSDGRQGEVPMARDDGTLEVAGVRVTSPDRVVWEEQGVTKGELVAYYQAVESAILPELRDRPLTLVRCPSGAGKQCFYQKHAGDSIPAAVPRVEVQEKDGRATYMYVNGMPSLISLVQIGVLEFHIWGSRRDRLDRPDRLVFDLDPDEALPFGEVAAAALHLRERLKALGLESFPKSTGGKGLHVVVPVTRRSDWDEARSFTGALARRMAADEPDRFTARMSRDRRTGRIFVDYLRNAANATAIADYSPRSRPGAPVAVRLSWDEVTPDLKDPPRWTIREVPDRLAEQSDPWAGYGDVRQSITAAMRNAVGV